MLCAVALAFVVGRPELSNETPLREVAAPIVVDVADVVIAGPEHNPDPEVQEAMEAHVAELRAEREANDGGLDGQAGAFASAFGGMTVSYSPTDPAPSSVRTVVDAAVAQWDAVIATNGSGPIVVEVFWSDLGNPSLLGYAGPDGMFYGGSLPADALYPAALTNTLLGIDANGSGRPEIQVVLNSQLLNTNSWYLGTTGTPPSGQIDLFSVVLHEVGHGLGFLGSATIPSGETQPRLNSTPYIYDTLASYQSTAIASVPDQGSALRSGQVMAQVSDGLQYELYAPAGWVSGSSFSHFDESLYPGGTAGALMTPMLGGAETARILDSPTLGLMARMGWPLTVSATTPTITSASPSLTAAVLGWDRNLWQTGTAPDAYVIEAWRNGSTLETTITVGGDATGAVIGSLSPGANYTIKVIPRGVNGNGTAATATVQLATSGGPADPSEWPTYIRDTALDGQINRLYQAYFLRLADQGGFDYWLGQRSSGVSLLDISAAFAGSAEFQNRYGALADGTFVDLVYANVLGRTADPGGRAYWVGQLQQGVSRGEVMIGFAESAEYVDRTQTVAAPDTAETRIVRLYRAFFLRDPDAGGLAYWADQLRSGVPLETVAEAFAGSAEFQNRYGSLGNAAFVDLVYTNVLGRSADAGGAAYWSGLLGSGTSRGTVMVGFSESAEFIRATGTVP